ncbi:olfactory receptor 1G1-like [Gastrophryne carolinensis]
MTTSGNHWGMSDDTDTPNKNATIAVYPRPGVVHIMMMYRYDFLPDIYRTLALDIVAMLEEETNTTYTFTQIIQRWSVLKIRKKPRVGNFLRNLFPNKMNECSNITLNEFYLLGFSPSRRIQLVVFVGVLNMYLLTIFGNLFIMTLTCLISVLHTPMYFFLCNLSVVDIMYVSSTLPKLLTITITQDNAISFQDCITQLYFFTFCAICDIFVLTSMAYDRYVAICKPLQYTLMISRNVCISISLFCWVISAFNSLLLTLLTSVLSFCKSHQINHFFCDLKTMTSLASSDTQSREIFILIQDILIAFFPFMLTIVSYVNIIRTILQIRSSEGRLKAFSSCTSHLTTVFLFYGPILFIYLKPESANSKEQDNLISMLYVAVVPMLNPFVYSLRNKDVLEAIQKLLFYKSSLL